MHGYSPHVSGRKGEVEQLEGRPKPSVSQTNLFKHVICTLHLRRMPAVLVTITRTLITCMDYLRNSVYATQREGEVYLERYLGRFLTLHLAP